MITCIKCQVAYKPMPDMSGVGIDLIDINREFKLQSVYSGDILKCPSCGSTIHVSPERPYAGDNIGNPHLAAYEIATNQPSRQQGAVYRFCNGWDRERATQYGQGKLKGVKQWNG